MIAPPYLMPKVTRERERQRDREREKERQTERERLIDLIEFYAVLAIFQSCISRGEIEREVGY